MKTELAPFVSKMVLGLLGTSFAVDLFVQSTQAEENWQTAIQTGGALTVYSFGESPYNHAAPFLELEERRIFSRGAAAFRKKLEDSSNPDTEAVLKITNDFNARSCESCHLSDGRGISAKGALEETGISAKPGDKPPNQSVFRHVVPGSSAGTLQNIVWEKAGDVRLGYGDTIELLAPSAIVNGVKVALDLRNAPGVYGLGLIEAIPAEHITSLANKAEFAKFGVKGITAQACDVPQGDNCNKLGRFGWKGTVADLEAQIRSALAGELGIHDSGATGVDGRKVEYEALVAELTDYVRVLAVPARRLDGTNDYRRGAEVFEETGCIMCHKPSWRTGQSEHTKRGIQNQLIYPFTDLLLHDMGEGLASVGEGELTRYWRTPALWGIGMQPIVSAKVGYLHDGRARDFTEAILWHGGEADYSVGRFKSLSPDDRLQLIEFLNSL